MMFCSQCGQPLVRVQLGGDTQERGVCTHCDYVHYENPKLLVWCFLHWHDRLLLCRRAEAPAQGSWNPPSGFVEAGETLEEAATRETYEETGVLISPADLILYRVASIPHMNQVYVGFRAELHTEPRLIPGPEVSEARFWAEAEIPLAEFAFRNMLNNVPEDFFQCLRARQFPVFAVTVGRDAPGK